MTLEYIKLDEIRDEAEHSGFRVAITAKFGAAKIPLKIDITIGNEVTAGIQGLQVLNLGKMSK